MLSLVPMLIRARSTHVGSTYWPSRGTEISDQCEALIHAALTLPSTATIHLRRKPGQPCIPTPKHGRCILHLVPVDRKTAIEVSRGVDELHTKPLPPRSQGFAGVPDGQRSRRVVAWAIVESVEYICRSAVSWLRAAHTNAAFGRDTCIEVCSRVQGRVEARTGDRKPIV